MEYVDYCELDITKLDPIGSGSNAEVYKYDDLAIKVYDDASFDCKNIQIDIFEDLRDIDLPGFIKLVDYDTVTCQKERFYKKRREYSVEEKEVIYAYSSKYIEKSNEKMIDKPIDYTLESLYEYKKLLEELNKRKILISDMHEENIIVSDSNAVIIDPDLFRYHPSPEKMNVKRIKDYIIYLWCNEYGLDSINSWYTIPEYFGGPDLDTCINNIKTKAKVKTPRELMDKDLKMIGV